MDNRKTNNESASSNKDKIGIDTNLIVHLIMGSGDPTIEALLAEDIFGKSWITYTSKKCVTEAIGVLCRDYNYKINDARAEVERFVRDRKIEVLSIPEMQTIFELMEQVKHLFRSQRSLQADCTIIQGFLDNKITHVVSTDGDFCEAAKFKGLHARKVPTEDRRIKDFFRKSPSQYR